MPVPAHAPAVYVATLVLATLAYAQPTRGLRNVKVGDQLPAFSVLTLDDTKIESSAYRGKVLLLVFARPQHDDSLQALRAAQRMYQSFKGPGLAVLAVSTSPESRDFLRQCTAEHKVTYPVTLDPNRTMYGDFGLIVAPTTLLIDSAGVLRFELAQLPPNFDQRVKLHVRLLLGELGQAEHDVLAEQLRTGIPKKIDPAERQLGLVRLLMEQEKYKQAISILDALGGDQKGHASVAILRGTCHLALGEIDKAADSLPPFANQEPMNSRLAHLLGRLALARGEFDRAKTFLQQALARSAAKGPIWYDLGLLSERRGDLGEAVEFYRLALAEAYSRRPHSFPSQGRPPAERSRNRETDDK